MKRCRKCNGFYSPLAGKCLKCDLLAAAKTLPPDGALRKGWVTPHGFMDFQQPVTYEEACKTAAELAELMRGTR